jgi:hypothetical protein
MNHRQTVVRLTVRQLTNHRSLFPAKPSDSCVEPTVLPPIGLRSSPVMNSRPAATAGVKILCLLTFIDMPTLGSLIMLLAKAGKRPTTWCTYYDCMIGTCMM